MKSSILNIWEGSKYVSGFLHARVLNIYKFSYVDRVLNMRRDAIMECFWIFLDSEYVRFLHMQGLHKVLNITEYGWIITYDRILFWICLVNVSQGPPVFNMPGLRMWQGCEYARVTQGVEYAWINLNML